MLRRWVRALLLLALPLIVLAVFSGCGESEGTAASVGGGKAALASAVPAGSLVYGEQLMRPQGDVKDRVLALLGRVLDKPAAEVSGYLRTEIAKNSDGGPSDVAKIDKFLGDRVAFAMTGLPKSGGGDPIIVMVLESPDPKALVTAALEGEKGVLSRSHGGVDYSVERDGTAVGVLDGRVLMASTEAAFTKAVDDIKAGRTLDKEQRFTEAVGRIDRDSLGLLYVDGRSLLAGADGLVTTASDKEGLKALRKMLGDRDLRVVAGLSVPDERTAMVDFALLGGSGDLAQKSSDLIKDLPASAWMAVATGDLGDQVKKALDQARTIAVAQGESFDSQLKTTERQLGVDLRKDFLDWMGDGALFVTGRDPASIGGGMLIESKDEAASRRAVATIGRIAGQSGQAAPRKLALDGAEALGFDLRGLTGVVAADGKQFFAGVGEAAARGAFGKGDRLGDSDAFKRAAKALDGLPPAMFVDLRAITAFAGPLAGADPKNKQALEILGRFDSFVAGGGEDGGVARARMVLTAR